MKKKAHLPASVREAYETFCSPKRGTANPENQTNPVWAWLVQHKAHPYYLRDALGIRHDQEIFPAWSFERFGQSETVLPDGRTIYIGGEHEDFYHRDFYIYNDVVVTDPTGGIEIFGYPTDLFPPTDFHTATLIGDEIWIIGKLAYPEDRDPDTTKVFVLNLNNCAIRQINCFGDAPPHLYKHFATLLPNGRTIRCDGGIITHRASGRPIENLTIWDFDIAEQRWHKGRTLPYTRWILLREDETFNDLRWIASAVFESSKQAHDDAVRHGTAIDTNLYHARYRPPIPHEVIAYETYPDDDNVHRIKINDVIVRYNEDMEEIMVTVEGHLDQATIDSLKRYGIDTFSALEGVPYKVIEL